MAATLARGGDQVNSKEDKFESDPRPVLVNIGEHSLSLSLPALLGKPQRGTEREREGERGRERERTHALEDIGQSLSSSHAEPVHRFLGQNCSTLTPTSTILYIAISVQENPEERQTLDLKGVTSSSPEVTQKSIHHNFDQYCSYSYVAFSGPLLHTRPAMCRKSKSKTNLRTPSRMSRATHPSASRLVMAKSALFVLFLFFKCCFLPQIPYLLTTIRNGEPRTSTSTFTRFL